MTCNLLLWLNDSWRNDVLWILIRSFILMIALSAVPVAATLPLYSDMQNTNADADGR